MGSKDSKILGAYSRDTLNDHGELLLSFADNHDLALVSTFFSTHKAGVFLREPPPPNRRLREPENNENQTLQAAKLKTKMRHRLAFTIAST